MTGHVALRHWSGPWGWRGPRQDGAGPPVHGGLRPGGSGARRGSARPRRRAMAASCELTVVALRCTGNRAEGTGVLAPASERDACVYGNTERPGRRVLVAERLDGGDATTMRSRTRLRKRGRTRRASTDSSPQREARGRSSSSGVRQPRESTAAGTSAPRLWW